MKIAIISDIHANARALRRVFDDLPSVDRVLCAGDAISEFRFCPDTVDLLRRHDVACIQGNHEHTLFERNPGYLAKCRAAHAPDLMDMLAGAPKSLDLVESGTRIHMVHATPWSPFSGYIPPGSPHLARIALLPFDVVILGHTHVAMVETAGAVTVINPGSCSEPRGTDRRASYAVLEVETRSAAIRYLRQE